MLILKTVLLAIEALASLLLIGLILIQKSKGGGFGTAFGGGMGESILGARAGNVLTKSTIVISCVFLVCTLFLTLLYAGVTDKSLVEKNFGPAEVPQAAPQQPVQPMPQQVPQAAPTVSTPIDVGQPAPAMVPVDEPALFAPVERVDESAGAPLEDVAP